MPLPYMQWTCYSCHITNATITDGEAAVEERFSLGIYAGRWCAPCWAQAGYRKDGPEGFDPLDAGESYEPI